MRSGIKRDDLLSGDIYKGLLKLSFPLMVLNLINTLYGMVDTYFVGKIGEVQVGAVSLVTPVTDCGVAFATGMSAAGIAMISRATGQNDEKKAGSIASHLIVLSVFLGTLLSALCLIFNHPILQWLETPADIYHDTYNYFTVISLDYIFLFILTIYQSIRQAGGDSKSGVLLNAVAALLNVLLDPLFISVFQWGTFGAALATMTSKMLVCPIALYKLLKKENEIRISFHNIQLETMGKIISVAVPASLGQFLSSFGFVLISKEIVSYGSLTMSGYGIGSKLNNFFLIPLNAIGSSLSTFIGQNLGAGNFERARECYRKANVLNFSFSAVITLLAYPSRGFLITFFAEDPSAELLEVAMSYTTFSIATNFFMSWFDDLVGVFDGSSNTKVSMFLNAGRLLFIRVPIVYFLKTFTDLGYTGIWVAMIVSNFIVCVIGQFLYSHFGWDRNLVNL